MRVNLPFVWHAADERCAHKHHRHGDTEQEESDREEKPVANNEARKPNGREFPTKKTLQNRTLDLSKLYVNVRGLGARQEVPRCDVCGLEAVRNVVFDDCLDARGYKLEAVVDDHLDGVVLKLGDFLKVVTTGRVRSVLRAARASQLSPNRV